MTTLSSTSAATPAGAPQAPTVTRVLGAMLVVLGAFFAVVFAIISVNMLPLVLNSGLTQDARPSPDRRTGHCRGRADALGESAGRGFCDRRRAISSVSA
jgi:hypothetical protein